MRSEKSHIASHVNAALEAGATPGEVLEAMELAIPEAGIVAFQHGFDAWKSVVGAEGIEPDVEAFGGGSKG